MGNSPILHVVGIGPGAPEKMTVEARDRLLEADCIIGYTVYTDLLKEVLPEKTYLSTPMRQEIERCRLAFTKAREGKKVCLVCSGDAGVYGLAGLMLETGKDFPDIEVQVVAGVSACLAGAALLGAPLVHDFCLISLSDLLTPWERIEKRLHHAALADFVICIYNPSSKKRADYLNRACRILLKYKDKNTPCGLTKQIGRSRESVRLLSLEELAREEADMFSTVFIGNSETKIINEKMVTPRGYEKKTFH